VTPWTDPDTGKKKTYAYDPHLDPQLQWAGKAEHTSFEVPTVSLHVHERIDPRTIIEATRKKEAKADRCNCRSSRPSARNRSVTRSSSTDTPRAGATGSWLATASS